MLHSQEISIVRQIDDNFVKPAPSGYRDIMIKFRFKGRESLFESSEVGELILTMQSIDEVAAQHHPVYQKTRRGEPVSAAIQRHFIDRFFEATLKAICLGEIGTPTSPFLKDRAEICNQLSDEHSSSLSFL
jgi:hypothetical protein